MKIIHITAAYKPAYIYGGPTMSVAKLCEALGGLGLRGLEVELGNCGDLEDGSFSGIEVEVLTTTANGKTELAVTAGRKQLVDGVGVTYFKRLTKDHTHFSPALLMGLRRKILYSKQNPPPTPPINRSKLSKAEHTLAIHIHAWWNLVSILSCWLAKLYHVPVILSPRGMLTTYTLGNRNGGFKSIIHSVIGKNLLSYCHIHATSEKEKADILKFIKPKSITVIPNLVERVGRSEYQVASSAVNCFSSSVKRKALNEQLQTSNEQQTEKLAKSSLSLPSETSQVGERTMNNKQLNDSTTQPTSTFRLIFLSRIEEKKGLELLFEALAKFDVDWRLTIAGSGEDEYVKSLKWKVESLGIAEKINWVGQVTNEDKFKLLAEHDLMVLTSYNENFANVVIESLSVGTPVLLSKQVGLGDYVIEKDLGWITELNAESIVEQLDRSYKAISTREKIRTEAPKIIGIDYNDATLAKKYIALYEQVL